jgi:hypothetical protein|tara:strand:+ start:578 stop:772 length:195 start_codon:yes stop_codon:yes gene_type:complete
MVVDTVETQIHQELVLLVDLVVEVLMDILFKQQQIILDQHSKVSLADKAPPAHHLEVVAEAVDS